MRLFLIFTLALLLIPAASAGNGALGKATVGIVESAPYVFGQTIHPTSNVAPLTTGGPYYSLYCYQADASGLLQPVYGVAQYRVYPIDGSAAALVLAGQAWTGGAAKCDLSVWHVNNSGHTRSTDATMSFYVDG